MLKYITIAILLTAGCAQKHSDAPVKEGDGVLNGGGSYQFYSASDPLFVFENLIIQNKKISYLELIDHLQNSPYTSELEKTWIDSFEKSQRLGFTILSEINNQQDWDTISKTHTTTLVVPGLYDPHTGNPLMAMNFTHPAKIYLAPHLWTLNAKENIIPCEETDDAKVCQTAQLATIAVHEKLGALGFKEERSGKYQFSSQVYDHIILKSQ